MAQPRRGCLVLDVRMPGMSGFDVLDCLAALGRTLPVVLVSGDGDIPTAVRAMNAGCSSFLAKPFEEDMLLDAVRQALQDDDESKRG
jgi:FixJ family two-component response regulator